MPGNDAELKELYVKYGEILRILLSSFFGSSKLSIFQEFNLFAFFRCSLTIYMGLKLQNIQSSSLRSYAIILSP